VSRVARASLSSCIDVTRVSWRHVLMTPLSTRHATYRQTDRQTDHQRTNSIRQCEQTVYISHDTISQWAIDLSAWATIYSFDRRQQWE